MMSTADSQLLVATSTFVEDFYSKALGRSLSHRGSVTLSRVVTLVVGLLGFLLAVTSDDLIYDVVSLAWAGLGSSFGPALVLSLHWRRMNGAGVVAGMVTGAVVTVVWTRVPGLDAALSVRFVSFVAAFAACVIAARLAAGEAAEGRDMRDSS
jgi:sodium/proline symporter